MGWSKQTINTSSLDQIKKTVEGLGLDCSVSVIETVWDRAAYSDLQIVLHRLCFKDPTGRVIVVLEQLTQTTDCDSDDYIRSYSFYSEDEPKDWKAVICPMDENYEEDDDEEYD